MPVTSNEMTQEVEQLYREFKPLLTSIAYKMLGSMAEAEDAVQDVFVTISKNGANTISHPKAYLVKLVTNRVLNVMKAAPRKRESYPGEWLPEPVIELGWEDAPLERVIQHEQLGYALLVLLQTCTPPERAVFVLRESFGYEYADIAAMLDKSEAACRKIFSRASAKIGQSQHGEKIALNESMEKFVQSFSQAIDSGRFEPFIHLLTDDAVLLSDGGGVVRAAINPIEGRQRVAAFLTGIAGKGSLAGEWIPISVSGQRGLLLRREGAPTLALVMEPDAEFTSIQNIYLIANPEKLTRITP
ncbi:RNA polymerase sigma factor SigJ [Paenibacillus radicis (ex Gao et al. 2016)]|uniref:RNA polymerase sigma factor SigJ n=1 Tax=Paenibacillus radicis (ex Gao et al. 2016) TaxID=1737354 RepID=A0A917H5M2_9BACL|nr:RNA polymerase sigma factor SigJ [Paenibacillus radicis (ex Gao et al. 2016)]